MRLMLALSRAGFRRYSTYRQAIVANAATNTVFGLLRVYVFLALATAGGGVVAGYSGPQLSTYVWVGQALIGVVALWGWSELADKVRTGEVVGDLLRPINPIWTYLAADLGRAGVAACTRMVIPMLVGSLFFPFYWPRALISYPLFIISVTLAVGVCFGLRYLLNLTTFWLLDIRGVGMLWTMLSGVGSGLYFPIAFLPDGLATALQYGTPFPSIVQFPADVLIERDGLGGQLTRLALQLLWCLICIGAAAFVQRLATRRLVVQGG